jgi:SRSO17 transposase
VAAGHSVDPDRWREGFAEVMARIGGRFGRVEPRRRARAFVLGLLAGLPRMNCWTIAEHAGDRTPDGMQHLLERACWDTDGVRDDLRGYVIDHLGDPGAVLVVDETGDLKKGTTTVGVQRQYTGTAGRIENAQVGIYLVYATGAGHAFLDRGLYLPRSWTDDPGRCRAGGVPEDVQFATKPALAAAMIARALDAGTPASWVAADEVYGTDSKFRAALHARGIGYVLAVACDHAVTVPTCPGPRRAADLAAALPAGVWGRYNAGRGAKGQRLYDWAMLDIDDPDAPGCCWLLIRRGIGTGELAFYRAYAPTAVSLPTLVRVAGRRWASEEAFQTGKGLTGLDEHQVRRWTPWHRWTILAMLAHAFLSVMTSHARAGASIAAELIPLTRNEIHHLFRNLLNTPSLSLEQLLDWSTWRRRHQARAQASHYRRQAARYT